MQIHRNESNLLHREDGPAVFDANLTQWYWNGKLHRPNGPAVMSPYGTRFFYWKGIFINPSYWDRKDEMTIEEIFAIENLEVRRSMIELIGFDEILRRAASSSHKPVLLDKDKHGYELYKMEMPEDDKAEPLVVIKLIDSTELKDAEGRPYRKHYHLRVPPDTTNCEAAVAWTFNMKAGEYLPEQEA